MVERRVCTFCGTEIEPGTGRMYIKKDGVVYNFCTSKCFKNMVVLGRVPRRTTWTRYYEREKEVRMKGLPVPEAEAPKAKKVKKPAEAEPKVEKKPEAEKSAPTPKVEKQEPKATEHKTEKPAPKEAPKKEKPAQKKEGAPKKESKPKTEAKPKPPSEGSA